MANTTNFGWETPDDTDLVKDGALAMRTLGNAIDTSLVDLKGGTSGQILAKNTNTDMDFVWINNDQGDITNVGVTAPITGGGSSGSVTIGIQDGTTTQKGAVQLENSTSSTSTTTAAVPASVKSAFDLANAAIPKSIVDAAGDIIYATANDTVARLGIGTAGQVLKVNSGATAPEWGAAGGASFVGVSVYDSGVGQTQSNNVVTALTWNSEDFDTDGFHSTSSNTSRITIPSGKGGKYLAIAHIQWQSNSSGSRNIRFRVNGDTNNAQSKALLSPGNSSNSDVGTPFVALLDLVAGDYVEVTVTQTSGGNLDVFTDGTDTGRARFSMTYLGA